MEVTKVTLQIRRVGTRSYTGENDRGATLAIGKGEGEWSPGELLKMALLGCNAMSADHRLAGLLGEAFEMVASIEGEYNQGENRYTAFEIELNPTMASSDGSPLSSDQVDKTIQRALGAIERQCTIGRTLDHPVPHPCQIRPATH